MNDQPQQNNNQYNNMNLFEALANYDYEGMINLYAQNGIDSLQSINVNRNFNVNNMMSRTSSSTSRPTGSGSGGHRNLPFSLTSGKLQCLSIY